jgi:tRNA (cmo5U34)-methyltransferase
MHDDIFKNFSDSFCFDKKVVNVFDDMLNRSIPFYKETLRLSASFLLKNIKNNAIVYDIGSSTGEFVNVLCNMNEINSKFNLQITAIDSSKSMIDKSKQKFSKLGFNVEFINGDITSYNLKVCNGIVMNYTLQFIPIKDRNKVIENIFNSLQKGGVFIFSEKVVHNNDSLSKDYVKEYYNFKNNNGYSDKEILNKQKSLQNILTPLTYEQNKKMLVDVGFKNIDCLFKWVNFATFIAIK